MPILEPCLVDLMQLVRESYILLIAVNRDITLLLVWTKKKKKNSRKRCFAKTRVM